MTDAPPFTILEGLMGREAEVQMLEDAYQRVLLSPHSCEAILVHGESGAGKTALVKHCFQRQREEGTFISGKFDVIHVAARPYSAIVDALTQLCQAPTWNNLSNKDELRASSSKRLGSTDLTILSRLIPAVEQRMAWFLDSDAANESDNDALPEQSPYDNTFAFARFTEVVRSFFYAVARFLPSPLVLFLDDVQAADKESLVLISSLTSAHTESGNLVLILAYRDSVDGEHEVEQCNLVSPRTDFHVTNIQVGNLDADIMNKLISSLLRMNENDTLPLSRLVTQRTGGNIYFSLQCLEMFHTERLLTFSFALYEWEWDLDKIRAETDVTENVAKLVTAKIRQLPSSVQVVLQLAACLGFYFDIEFLERMAAQGIHEAIGERAEDESDQIGERRIPTNALISSDEFTLAIEVALKENLVDRTGSTKYKFTHDRVLQAAYEMIPAGRERDGLHWRIGQVLWREVQQRYFRDNETLKFSDDWLLFAAADQLNRGSDCGTTRDDVVSPLDLARLNLEAGKTALEKSAFKHAAGFFNKGVEIVKDMWQSEYSLCLDLHTLSAEAEYTASNFKTCDIRVDEILANGRCLEDKLRAYLVQVQSQGVRGNILQALDQSISVVRILGEQIPRRPNTLQLILELSKTKRVLRRTKIADFVFLPDMTDPLKIWATKFLQDVTLYSWYAGQFARLVVSACRMVRLTAKFGVSSQSPFGLATYGVSLGFLGDLTTGYEVGRVTLELTKRPHTGNCYARTVGTVFTFLNYLKEPFVRSLGHFIDGYNTGMKSGEIDGAAMCLTIYAMLGIFLGKNLNVVLTEMVGFRQAYRDDIETNFTMIRLLPWHQFALNMSGRSEDPLKLSGEVLREEAYLIEARRTGNAIAKTALTIARMMLLYILCDIEGASKEVANQDMAIASKGTHLATPFLLTIAALTMLASARETRKRKYLIRARDFARIMTNFAKAGNLNIPPLLELVAAEQASLQRRISTEEVKLAYESAVRMASRSGFTVFEAIGNERAAEYMLSIGDTFWAETYLSRAFRLYDEWGATAKTTQMMNKYPFLARPDRMSRRTSVAVSMRKRYNFKASNESRRLSTR